jgi:AmiR/NasT family two-component response regulator
VAQGTSDDQASTRIIVAEDEAVIRMDLVETLREEGYAVVDGIEVTRRVSDITAVVVVTAFGQRERVSQARDAGAMAYLVKPVSRDDLVPAIEMAWSGWLTLRDLHGQAVESAAAAARAEQRLAERRDVERAKGILARTLGLDEDDAYRWLRQTAMDSRSSLSAVARQIVDAAPPQDPAR